MQVVCARDGALHPLDSGIPGTIWCSSCGDLLFVQGAPTGTQWPTPPVLSTSYSRAPVAPVDVERQNIRRAYAAVMRLERAKPLVAHPPVVVRSRAGMLRLVRKVFGLPKDHPVVRWSWPATEVARAARTRAWP